ncbi:MAG: BNR-4 repeat-containing protein [Thermoguttaceae bacterium]|jgi:hypothetical protein
MTCSHIPFAAPRPTPALVLLLALLAPSAARCEEDVVVLFDSGGFADASVYPPGDLAQVAHGEARWTPAGGTARPARIETLQGDRYQRVLRRCQTGEQPVDADLLDFPPAALKTLTVAFDARVSTAQSRTLDLVLLRPGLTDARDQASFLIWGYHPGKLSYFDGQYRDIAALDEQWHRYEVVHNLDGGTFDLWIDGRLVREQLRWRNAFPPGTAFGRLRIGSIRGSRDDYADLANLRITSVPAPPAIALIDPQKTGGILSPGKAFRFRVSADRPVETGAIRIWLNGEDVTKRLRVQGTPTSREVTLEGLAPNTSYRAKITAENARGSTECVERFYTFRDKVDGYRGIWFTLGQMESEYGDKYSGGLAFCFSHTLVPMAVYAPEVEKTFFVYGGTTGPEDRYLLAMASYYDHKLHRVPRPTIVRDQRGINDPHDNPSLTIDQAGHVWVFLAGRGRARPGQIFRSKRPYSVDAFDEIISREQTYSQIWQVPGKGFFHLLTLYTRGRELYWETSPDGRNWTAEPAQDLPKLAGFDGHYQVSRLDGSKIGTAFNYHPGGSVDRRTNIYYAQTTDFGQTWTTVDGRPLTTPLDNPKNPALVVDYEARGRLFYITKLLFDEESRPVILGVSSGGYAPGPQNDPRIWEITRWTGHRWVTSPVTQSDHNYDMGSLYLDGSRWTVIGPALTGPQAYFTGGEVGLWVSTDRGANWSLERRITEKSPMNHSYVRRPHNPADPFFAVWADGDSSRLSPSRLYFTNSTGDRLYMLPYQMDAEYAEPVLLDPPTPPPADALNPSGPESRLKKKQ